MTDRYIAAGTQLAFLGTVDSQGFLVGGDPTTTGAMIRLLGIQTANPGPVEGEDVNVPGDDTSLGKIEFGPAETPSFVVNLGAFDLRRDAVLQGTAVEAVGGGGIQIGVIQPNEPEYPDVCLIIQSKSKKKDTGADGVKAWSGYIIPLCTAQPLHRETFEGRTAANDRIRVTTQVASRKPWGVTILSADLGTTGAPLLPFTADNPIVMQRFTGDGATTTFTLRETPISSAKTVIYRNTQLLTTPGDYSVNTSTRVITFTGAPADQAKIEVLMEFAP